MGKLQVATCGAVAPPAESGLSDIVQFRLTRDTANESDEFAGADTLTGAALAVSFDVHYQIDSLGSDAKYVKYTK